MKKLFFVWTTMVLILGFHTAALADIAVNGDLRMLYKIAHNTSVVLDENGFVFDRLNLNMATAINEDSGVNGTLQFCKVGVNQGSDSDIRLDTIYLYAKNLFTVDQLDCGYLDLTFNSGDYIALIGSVSAAGELLSSTETYNISPDNSVGIKYQYLSDEFHAFIAIVNAAHAENANIPGGITGLDYEVRAVYRPWDELTFGIGYAIDSTDNYTVDRYFEEYVIDIVYDDGTFGVFTEYVSKQPHNIAEFANESARTGAYVEGHYNLNEKSTVYAGGSILASELLGGDGQDYRVTGVRYLITTKYILQSEYLFRQDNTWSASLRLRALF